MDAAALQARLELLARVRAVELALTRQEHARAAAMLVRARSHQLGNHVQIMQLASLELERRLAGGEAELIGEVRDAAEGASSVLAELFAAARAEERITTGAPVVPAIRAAVEQVRRATPVPIDMRIDLDSDVCTRATRDELEVCMLASLLYATWGPAASTRLVVWVRQRQIAKKPWIELLVIADRAAFDEALGIARAAVQAAGGEASISEGRDGVELAIELPVA
jgi:hypothetical protein